MPASGQKQKPVFTKSYFPIRVAVFEFLNGDDGRRTFSVSLSRSFQRSEGAAWESTHFLAAQDLLAAAKLLSEAHSFVQAQLQKAYEERRSNIPEVEIAAADIPF